MVKDKFSEVEMKDSVELIKKWLKDLAVVYGDLSFESINKYMVVLALAQMTLVRALHAEKNEIRARGCVVTVEVEKE